MAVTTTTIEAKTVPTKLNFFLDLERGGTDWFIPGTAGYYRRKFDTQEVRVRDIRGQEADFNLSKQGFQLHRQTTDFRAWLDEKEIKAQHYPETARLLEKM